VPRPDLDPTAAEQSVPLVFRPDRVPWGSDTATLTVVADHGERRSVSYHARRVPWAAFAAAAFTFMALVILFVALFAWLAPGPPRAAVLEVKVFPKADHVFLNGSEVGSGRRVETPLPEGAPVLKIRVETDGFAPWERQLPLTAAPLAPVDVNLTLVDRMDWSPPADLPRRALAPVAERLLDSALPDLGACYAAHQSPAEVSATWVLLVTPEGTPRNLTITDSTFPSVPAEHCVRGVVRSLDFPAIEGGYGFIQRKMTVRVAR